MPYKAVNILMEAHIMQKKNVFKVLALLCVLVLVVGSIPVSAAKLKTIAKRINNGISAEEPGTIKITTKAEGTIVVHSDENSSNKSLYINAPNAKVVNYANFKIVSIKACKKYVEKGEDNDLKVTGTAKIQVTPGGSVGTISVKTAAPVEIVAGAGAEVAQIAVNKTGADIDITVADGAMVGVEVNKKADVTLEGSTEAVVGVLNHAEDTKLTTSVPTYLETEQSMDLVANEGSEGSIFDKTNDAIDVNVTNNSEEPVVVTVDGEIPSGNPDNASTAAITVEGIN